jgi:glucose/arabinose dehydrogenase
VKPALALVCAALAAWGRPAGLTVAADGSLLIADGTGGGVWRLSYGG